MYQVGDSFYYTNKRTGEVKKVEIEDIQYRFSCPITGKRYLFRKSNR